MSERDLPNDPGIFAESIARIAAPEAVPYLGDLAALDALLRVEGSEAVDEAMAHEQAALLARARRFADVMLGKDKAYSPVHKWNEPGKIDVFAAKWCGVDADTPEDRMAGAFLAMVSELMKFSLKAAQGVKRSQWGWQVDATIQKYARILIGIDLPTQATM
jgi:hypothetical protein